MKLAILAGIYSQIYGKLRERTIIAKQRQAIQVNTEKIASLPQRQSSTVVCYCIYYVRYLDIYLGNYKQFVDLISSSINIMIKYKLSLKAYSAFMENPLSGCKTNWEVLNETLYYMPQTGYFRQWLIYHF